MKKTDFKKLALLGLAAGSVALSSTATAEIHVGSDAVILAAGCGAHGCNGASSTTPRNPKDGQIAEEDQVPPADGKCKTPSSCKGSASCQNKQAPTSNQYRA